MNLKSFLLPLLLISVFCASCDKDQLMEIDETFELNFGEQARVQEEQFVVEFVDITRTNTIQCCCFPCPMVVYPIVHITTGKQVYKIDFSKSMETIRGNWNFTLQSISPNMDLETTPNKMEDYVMELKVTSL